LFLSTPNKKYWNILTIKEKDHINEVNFEYMKKLVENIFEIKEIKFMKTHNNSFYEKHEKKDSNLINMFLFNMNHILYNLSNKIFKTSIFYKKYIEKIKICDDKNSPIQIFILKNNISN